MHILFHRTISGLRFVRSRLRKNWLGLVASGLVLTVIVFAAPELVWVAVGGFLFIAAANVLTVRRTNVRDLRRMVERREERTWPRNAMKSIVEALDVPAFILDRDAILRYANRSSVDYFGTVQPGDPIFFKFRTPQITHLIETAISENARRKIEFHEDAGIQRWFDVECIPVPRIKKTKKLDDPSKFFLLVFFDKTQLLKADQMRSDFVANASHELRTPLASLSGYIETLLGPARNDVKAQEKFLSVMLVQAERMSRLIDDLLSLSHVEMKAHMAPQDAVDITQLLLKVGKDLEPVAEQYSAHLHFSGIKSPASVIADGNELEQVFRNLIENACKYGRAKGNVHISVSRSHRGGGAEENHIRVNIRDDGPGIALNHIPRLTERFFRVPDNSHDKPKGTGLGLAIVKHILARHGAELKIDSKVGKGTSITTIFNVL